MFRLIQHLSYTKDFSFTKENNGISFDDTSVSHATVKDATGKVCMLVKIVFDVKSAFCLFALKTTISQAYTGKTFIINIQI